MYFKKIYRRIKMYEILLIYINVNFSIFTFFHLLGDHLSFYIIVTDHSTKDNGTIDNIID